MSRIGSLALAVFLSIFWAQGLFAQTPEAVVADVAPEAAPMSPQSIEGLPADIRQQISEGLQAGRGEAREGGELPRDVQERMGREGAAEDPYGRDQGEDVSVAQRTDKQFSRIETKYRTGYASALASDLRQFGYEIFDQTIPKPSRLAVPGDDYVLGPGDRMRIRVWGSDIDTEFAGEVDRSGNINIPRIGVVPVSGVPFGQVESVIRGEAEKYIQGINIHVSLVDLRSLEVYVVGSVQKPGLHLVPAFSTVLDALLAGGPVRRSGSMRTIALYRDGVLHREVDLYQLLLKGDREADVRIQNRDVVFVPRIGQTAAITGAFAEEGIYELREEKTIGELVELSGGILPQSFTGRIHLRRYVKNQEFVIQDIDTTRHKNWQATKVQDGDLLEVQFLSAGMPRVIRLMGHVKMPDVFRYERGISLRDIIKSPELLQPGAITDHALLHRYDPVTARYSMSKFPLDEVFRGRYNQPLKPYDRVEILSMGKLGIMETVSLRGAVTNPGTLDYRSGLTLRDVLISTDILKPGAVTDHALLHRYDREQIQYNVSRFPLKAVFDGTYNLPLEPHDRIEVLSRDTLQFREEVTVSGAVWNEGTFTYFPGQTLADIMALAGDFQFGARMDRIELSRNTFEEDEVVTRHSVLNLEVDGGFVLQPYDYIRVPKVKDAELKRVVTLTGEFRFPGSYRIAQDERLSDIIQRAGGMTSDAYYFGAKYTTVDSQRIQKQALDSMINQLQLRSQTVLYDQTQSGDAADRSGAQAGMTMVQNLINRMSVIKPEGRISIALADLETFRGSVYDFELEHGDVLHMPRRPNFVTVTGSVFSPSSYLYEPNQTVGGYLAKAGGLTKTADKKNVYLIKANGEVVSEAQSSRFGRGVNSVRVMPGDQIVVPEDLERVPFMRAFKDITDVVFKIATTAGVVLAVM